MSIERIRENAKNGDVESIVKLGRCYLNGIGVEQDVKQAAKCFASAADKDNAEAKTNLAYLYIKGFGVPKDEDKGVDLYRQAAEAEDPIAMYCYGLILKKGLYGRKKNPDKFKVLFEKAAAKGNIAAKYEVGLLQEIEAAPLLASQDMMTKNKGVAISNKVEALFKEAADKGHVPAKYALGVKYLKSNDKNKQKLALDLFLDCVQKGVSAANYAVAYMYDMGVGVEQNYWESYAYFKKAYDLGYSPAILNVAYAHMTGLGVKRDYKKAIDICRDAVNAGIVAANYYAGLCFKYGLSVEQDIDKAKELFSKAETVEYAPAVYQLGQLEDPSYSVGNNLEKAKEYYNLAASIGFENAKAELARIDFQNDKKKNFDILKKCAEKESYVANELLGEIYEEGNDIAKDLKKAYEYFKKAADLGSVTAAKAVLRIAKELKDNTGLDNYKDKITIKREPEDYLEAARECKSANQYERAAFWYAMAYEYAEDEEIVDKAHAALSHYQKGPDGTWTIKK